MPLNMTALDLLFAVGIPAVGDLISSRQDAGAVRDATGAQIAANKESAEIQQQMQRENLQFLAQLYGDQVTRQLPFYRSGVAAQGELNRRMGLEVAPSPEPDPFNYEAPTGGVPGEGTNLQNLAYQAPNDGQDGPDAPSGPGWPEYALTAASVGVPLLASLGGKAATTAAGAGTAAGGGFGSTLAGLATNPITIGVAGGLAAGGAWLKSQAHWEANDIVENFENPFGKEYLPKIAKAVDSGQITREQGVQALTASWQNYQDETKKWAGDSSDRQLVQRQSVKNLSQYVPQLIKDWSPQQGVN